ncbi:Chromatin assembly factor 1, subunit A [Cyanidiococcus yangmingshanensis]|uniref:Chromatin assembly factor 1, subunit A n=1 Tax=Cyanidiococcus yangmingshanensis TaxID=2690220 RepID=A0A7J7IHP0_9RHOD|nr:Chromatin assembly factor 1, subunit A [Cyanidiococcus yangmingshanensis]
MVSVSNAVWDPDACRAPRLRLSMAMDIQIAALRMLNPDHVPNSLDALQNLCDLLEELRQMKKTCLVCVFLQRWSRGATFAIAGRRLLSPKDIAMIDAGIMKVKFQVADEKIDSSTLERVWNVLRKKHIVNFSSISGRIVKPGYRYLHFEENNRPPYYGPWPLLRQIERIRPRAPFAILDSDLIDYDCDSDADWEDEGCGEDLSSCSCDEVAENSSSSIEDGTGSEADAEFIDDGHELSETESYHTGSQDDALQGKCRLPLTESHEARLLPDENRSPSSPANHQPKLIQRFITGIQYEIKSESVLNQFKVIPCISAPTELYIEEPDMPSTKASPLRTPTKGESATPHHHERFVEKKQDPAAKATTHLNIWSAFQRVVPKRARRADPFDDTKNEIDANNEEVISRLREADAWRLEPSTAGGLRNPQSDNPTAFGHDQELIEPRDL